jgi:hypothetical protein
MDSDSTKTPSSVPDELMDQLHKANDTFREARRCLESELNGTRQQDRIKTAADGLRAAERDVEEITEQIQKKLHPSGPEN